MKSKNKEKIIFTERELQISTIEYLELFNQIMNLVDQLPNDMDLGKAVRALASHEISDFELQIYKKITK